MKAKDMPIGTMVRSLVRPKIPILEVIALQDEQGNVILENVNDVVIQKGKA